MAHDVHMAKKRCRIARGRALAERRCDSCVVCQELMAPLRRVAQEGVLVRACSCRLPTCFSCAEQLARRHTLQWHAAQGHVKTLLCMLCKDAPITELLRLGRTGKVLEREAVPNTTMSTAHLREHARRLCQEQGISKEMLLDRAKPSIAEEEDEYRWHVLTRLREAGVLDELSEDYAVWRLAHLVGAGSRERVHDELWNNPIGWQPVIKGAFNPASALVESAPELPKRAPMKRQRFDPSDPCASSGERAVLMGTTHGLSANGFAAVARCCSWPDAADRAEALSYVMCRLVAVGAAVHSLRGRKLQSEV